MTQVQNTSGIHPKGNKVLLRPTATERQSKGGILIPTQIAEREDMAAMFGYVVAMGPTCYLNEGEPRCKSGDYVIFAKYAGQLFKGDDGISYRLINSTDVIATKDANPEDQFVDGISRKEAPLKLDLEEDHV